MKHTLHMSRCHFNSRWLYCPCASASNLFLSRPPPILQQRATNKSIADHFWLKLSNAPSWMLFGRKRSPLAARKYSSAATSPKILQSDNYHLATRHLCCEFYRLLGNIYYFLKEGNVVQIHANIHNDATKVKISAVLKCMTIYSL